MSERESDPACARGSVIFFSAMWRHIVSAQGVMRQIMKGLVSIDSAVRGHNRIASYRPSVQEHGAGPRVDSSTCEELEPLVPLVDDSLEPLLLQVRLLEVQRERPPPNPHSRFLLLYSLSRCPPAARIPLRWGV
jgi:hypothetical protein